MSSASTPTGPSPVLPSHDVPIFQRNASSGDGREERLFTSLLSQRTTLEGHPQAVLDAINVYAEEHLLNVGAHKGTVMKDVIRDTGAKLVLELGSYVGCSAIDCARYLPLLHPSATFPTAWPDSSPPALAVIDTSEASTNQLAGYICLEKSEAYAHMAQGLIDLAGLTDIIKIILGPSTRSILSLHRLLPAIKPGTKFDVVLLDHCESLYTLDLKALEEGGWIGPGTTVIATCVINSGNPRYLAYMRSKSSRACFCTRLEVADSGRQEDVEEVDEETGSVVTGVPGLMYESRLFMGWNPHTGEKSETEMSRCVGTGEPE